MAVFRDDMSTLREQQRNDIATLREQQRSDIAAVREELRLGFAGVNLRLDGISRDVSGLRERVARIEGHLGLRADPASRAGATPAAEKDG